MPKGRTKRIPVERNEIPHFASEAEEAAFWSTHTFGPQLLSEMGPDFDPDLPPPDDVRAYLDKRRRRERAESTQPVPIRFEVDLLQRLRALAARRHIGYQTLLKRFVAERLYEEEKREGLIPSAAAPGRE